MKNIYKFLSGIILLMFFNLPSEAVDLMCKFDEYNLKVPETIAHNLHIHVKFDDKKNTISYVHFGKVKKVDRIVDYNYEYLLFKIRYKYSFGETEVLYKIDRGTNKIEIDRDEILNANRSYTAKYKGYGSCEIIPRKKTKL